MATTELTVTQDLTIRQHLALVAKSLRARYANTVYQGDYVDTVTNNTVGDRLQVGTTYKAKTGERYLLVLNVLVARKVGGAVSVRVSAWRIGELGTMEGSWVVRRTDLKGVRLTTKGFVRRLGGRDVAVAMPTLLSTFISEARTRLDAGKSGRQVVELHCDRNGQNWYDTSEEHLLAFGGYDKATERLMH
jgi:hypothetical protein